MAQVQNNINSVAKDNEQVDLETPIDDSTYRFMSSFIVGAIKENKMGKHNSINELISEFDFNEHKTIDWRKIHMWIHVLNHHVSLLDDNCIHLIEKVLAIPWVLQQDIFIESFQRLIKNLITARSTFIQPVIKMIVQHFTIPKSTEKYSIFDTANRFHSLLQQLFILVPTAPNVFFTNVISLFPRKRQAITMQEFYCINLFRVSTYAPSLTNQILGLIVEKVIKIDVEVQVEVEELNNDTGDNKNEDIFEMEINEDRDSEIDSEDEIVPFKTDPNEMVDKLDIMLNAFFDFLSTKDYNSFEGEMIYAYMLNNFKDIILKTFKSRYTQFLLFYLCSKNTSFSNRFLGDLFGIMKSKEEPQVTRIASAAYIGSFIARAQYIDTEYVRTITQILTSWLLWYLKEYEPNAILDPVRHAVFYATTQAVLYIFCFRWKMFKLEADMDSHQKWHPAVSCLQFIINSKINPLKVCNEVVVEQFSNLSEQLLFIHCYTILENNKKLYIPLTTQNSIDLEVFFPFDPYRLNISSKYIEDLYVEWEGLDDDKPKAIDDFSNNISFSPLALKPIAEPLPVSKIRNSDTGKFKNQIPNSLEEFEISYLGESLDAMSIGSLSPSQRNVRK